MLPGCVIVALFTAAPGAALPRTDEGAERYYGLRFRPAAGLPATELVRFEAADGRPLFAFTLRGEVPDLVTHAPAPRGHYQGQMKAPAQQWSAVAFRVLWSADAARGRVEVWLNGDKMIDGVSMATRPGDGPVRLTIAAAGVESEPLRQASRRAEVLPPHRPRVPGALHADVEYARPGSVPLHLDAWIPRGKGPFPAVIIVHGGAFVRGDKQSYVRPLLDVLAGAGFAWFTVDYRLGPRHKYPAAVEDVEAAVAWVHANARKYRVDTRKVSLFGESAGGYLVSLVGTRHRRGGKLAAILPWYTYHEFTLPRPRADGSVRFSGTLTDFFGVDRASEANAALLRDAAPLRQAKPDMPPFLIWHSRDDPAVPYAQPVAMCERMKELGARCDLFTAEAMGHGLGKWKDAPDEHRRLLEWLRALP